MRVFPVTWQRRESHFRPTVAENPTLLSFTELELLPTEVLHCGNTEFRVFGCCDLIRLRSCTNLTPSPIPEHIPKPKMNFLRQSFRKLSITYRDIPASTEMDNRVRLPGHLSWYVTSHPGQLSLAIPSWVGAISTSQMAVTPCGWWVKAGIVRVWVAGKTVWSHCYTRAISERLREKRAYIKRYITSSVYFTLL